MPKRRKSAKRPRVRVKRSRKDNTSAIESVLAALAHDIRTPLTGILAHAELLAASDLGTRERNWALGVKSAAEHLAQLTTIVCDGVRADARGLALRQESFSLHALADDLGASLAARAHMSGLSGNIEVARGLPERLVGDAVRLRAAVENLIDNAVKFTARGTVTLRISGSPARNKARLTFAVTDSGIGLKPAEIKKLFRPFAQASEDVSRRYGGTGLGLTLVRRVARAMGGDLTVTSKPGKGSTFRLDVVAAIENGKHSKKRKASGPLLRGSDNRGRQILCVEDSPYGRVVLNTILREFGDHVDFVPTGEAALQALKRGGYDLVLMDVMLNGADGFAITRRIRALPKPAGDIPVIGISARSNGEAQAREAGMNAYLSKPVSAADLAAALEHVSRPKR